jgi:hypothetical protein
MMEDDRLPGAPFLVKYLSPVVPSLTVMVFIFLSPTMASAGESSAFAIVGWLRGQGTLATAL